MTGGRWHLAFAEASCATHSDLRSGDYHLWRDFVYYVPLLKDFARRVYVPPGSHEAMNLDSPEKGPKFGLAIEAARQGTCQEYQMAAQSVLDAGGRTAVDRFLRWP